MRTFYSAMAEAFPNARLLSAEEAIQTSHYYMRFLPQSTEEYDTLRTVGIDMYPYPLDYALEQSGEVFTQTENESDTIIWQYAVVDKNLTFPDYIQHEVLQETYMPLLVEEEGVASGRTAKVMLDDEVSTGEFLEMCAILDNNLLDSALIAMNLFDSLYYDASLEDTVDNSGGRIAGKRWKFRLKSPFKAIAQVVTTVRNTINSVRILKWGPEGRIAVQYVHPRTGATVTEGVANVEVVARQGLLNRRTFTRTDGTYVFEFPAFAPVWYNIRFQNNFVNVKFTTGFLTATKPGPVKALNRGWNYTATMSDSWALSWCAVMNAANDYYKVLPSLNNEYETDAPPKFLKIKVTSGSGLFNFPLGDDRGMMHNLNQTLPTPLSFLVNDILVRKAGEGSYTYDRVYATTIHELGHAAHWNLLGWTAVGSGVKMLNTDSRVRETWADAVMQFAYRRKFNSGVALNVGQTTPTTGRPTGPWVGDHQQCDLTLNQLRNTDYVHTLGPDMWDNFNPGCGGITDNVSNIPLQDLYKSLKDARTWNEWRDEIIERHPDQATEITAYFAQF